jgi:hypothetical protein
MLSPKYANDIRNLPELSLTDNLATELHVNLPGFEPFRVTANDNIIQDTVRIKITQNLGKYRRRSLTDAANAGPIH